VKSFSSPTSKVSSKLKKTNGKFGSKNVNEKGISQKTPQTGIPKKLMIEGIEVDQKESTDYRFSPCFNFCLRILQFSVAILLGLLGIVRILYHWQEKDFADMIISGYVCLFATILFSYELSRIIKISVVENILRENFGFLYGLFGKGSFIFFIAFFTLGVKNEYNLYIGLFMILDGFLLMLLHCKYSKGINKEIMEQRKQKDLEKQAEEEEAYI